MGQRDGRVGVAGFHVSINGIDPAISTLIGVNGWVTFIGGILMVIFACFEMTYEELQLAILTAVVAAVTPSSPSTTCSASCRRSRRSARRAATSASGWGLICVLSAAVLATLIAPGEVASALRRLDGGPADRPSAIPE